MNTNKTIVCGFLAVIFALALAACSAAGKGQKLTGTDSFKFTVINNGTAYRVSKGTATEGTVNIPASYRPNADSDYLPVTEIADGAFKECENITKITIPAGVTVIGDSAFKDCTNLTSITIPASITEIGDSAFSGCSNLTSITIPCYLTYYLLCPVMLILYQIRNYVNKNLSYLCPVMLCISLYFSKIDNFFDNFFW